MGIRYLILFFCSAVLGGLLAYSGGFFVEFAACGSPPRQGDVFLAACTEKSFGDFEHAAYSWDLEPQAVKHLQAARLIFLGNSRMQFIASTNKVHDFVVQNDIPYYAFGFGFRETLKFSESLLQRYHVVPQVYVINADLFYQDQLSSIALEVEKPSEQVIITYLIKWAFVSLQQYVCGSSWICERSQHALYRVVEDGTWVWKDYLAPPTLAYPIAAKKSVTLTEDEISRAIANASTFLAAAGVPRQCVILTGVPNSEIDSEKLAEIIGLDLKLNVVVPQLDNLQTIDTSHLNAESGERWATAFLSNAAGLITACLSQE